MNTEYTPNRHTERWPLPWLRTIGFRYLIAADALALFGLATGITALRFGTAWPSYSIPHHLLGFGLATLIHLVVYYFGGLYEYEQRLGRPTWLTRTSSLTFLAFLIITFLSLFTSRFLMPRVSSAFFLLGASLITAFNRWLSCSVRSKRFGNPRVLLIGSASDADLAITHLKNLREI